MLTSEGLEKARSVLRSDSRRLERADKAREAGVLNGELVETLSAEGVALHNLASLPHA